MKRLVLVEDLRCSVSVKVLDVDQEQSVCVLEREPQAAFVLGVVGERDVVQSGIDLCVRALAVDVHELIEGLAYVVE